MNTYQFFNQNSGKDSRLVSGWAIIRPTGATLQTKLAVSGIEYDGLGRTRFDAFLDELAAWDGTPRIFLLFDKASIPIANLFMTIDLRAVRICAPSGVETFDYTQKASPSAGIIRRNLEKLRAKNAA
jgi:hypothetical protein